MKIKLMKEWLLWKQTFSNRINDLYDKQIILINAMGEINNT